jgi:GNAT superfamily N-acetyltransferase
MPMTIPEANALSDANLIDAIRVHASWQHPCDVVEQDGVILLAGSTRFPGAYLNCVVRVNPAVAAAEVLQRATDFFAERNRGFTVITRASIDADLEASMAAESRYELQVDSPCMWVNARVATPVIANGLRLEAMATEAHVHDAIRVLSPAYALLGMPDTEIHKLFAHPQRLLSSPKRGCVIYRNDEPVATALVIQSGRAAGIYWVGTSPSAQRMGLASVCTAWVTNTAFDAGAEVVNLQASTMGAPVYERMGFRPYDHMRWHLRRANRPS